MRQNTFSTSDLSQLAGHGISPAEAERQLQLLRHPPVRVRLDRPCVLGDGILALSDDEQQEMLALGRATVAKGRVTKFVPASGAATRMFEALIAASTTPSPSALPAAREFFHRLDAFPFAAELRARAGVPSAPSCAVDEQRLLATLLDVMGYRTMPKGLIPFHTEGRAHTAFEDQLDEGARYTRADHGVSRMHFTVVREARADFERLLSDVRAHVEAQHDCRLDVQFSEQRPSTDTLAIDEHGDPFRTGAGDLLFRPSGHGALLDNLQALDGDVVVIKNIDNVLPPRATREVVRWKLILIGLLARLEAAEDEASDRPRRVCGVVKNEGEPGGAPFWVRGGDGFVTRQLVESAQVDHMDVGQQRLFAAATHFNPVDIVCSVRDGAGRPFPLADFVDPSASFVATKSYEGRCLTALERPGLWNGAMARWNTVFVEVPASTFAPVKTVLDLLRPQHQ